MAALLRKLPRHVRPSRTLIRSYSSTTTTTTTTDDEPDLKETLRAMIPAKREELARIKKEYGDKVTGEIRVENILGGMRGLRAMLWESSVLDPEEGIRFHGRSIKDCQRHLPRGRTGKQMLPEAMFWLLLTGQVPSENQVRRLSQQLTSQVELPRWVTGMLNGIPRSVHPMTVFAMAVAALNKESRFAGTYRHGLPKENYWEPVFDDCISLLAKLPTIAATIYGYHCISQPGQHYFVDVKVETDRDWAQNFAAMLEKGGAENEGFHDLMRLYLALHGDHEGGNVSAHATHLVGSALSDPFLSYSAGLLGLAGPLHGLAAQEVLSYVKQMSQKLGATYSDQDIRDYVSETLANGRVIPGYGHAVLRKPDPRFEALMEFAASRPEIQENALFQLVKKNSRIVPEVLQEHGKTKNPFPNVDAVSGVLFHHYGLLHPLYYTVTFGVSRGMGPLAQLIWDRALGLPIERPKSINLAGLVELAKKS
ncbi:hypothetical protein XA68_12795 [Ophiocordyceps unilateralis]|uniref:Citrate synthase n=1 Tax=Ophiocordyceps unilateralis TaxID=268505 RepID=A0A2A9PD22_OPHUN|nr:hypothetical protein XA68_12795 [Ophiocordyceps unilateralis]